jgi:hypothetical protein
LPRAARIAAAWVSVVFGALLLVTQIVGAGHMVLVVHDHCSEHGELVHADASHGEHAKAAPPERGSHSEVRPNPSGSHEHCDHPALKHTLVDLTSPCAELALLDGFLLPWSVRARAADAPLDPLDLAPKSSPPASL